MLIFVGVGAFTYFGGSVANYFVAGELRGVLERRRMENQIGKLSDHYIICGFGRMGAQVANELEHEHVPFVVLDFNEDAIDIARFRGHLALKGDAEEDSLLRSAGVERARGLIAVLAEDSSNLMVTVSARAMREDLFILARINRESSESKLMAAGANRVIWADGLAGRRIAQMALRPNVVEFLALVVHDRELELWMEEVPIAKESSLADTDLGSTRLREQTGVMIVAVRQVNGRVFTAPGPETRLGAGDIILVLGKREQISEARKLASIADADQRSQT